MKAGKTRCVNKLVCCILPDIQDNAWSGNKVCCILPVIQDNEWSGNKYNLPERVSPAPRHHKWASLACIQLQSRPGQQWSPAYNKHPQSDSQIRSVQT